jgi:hypothetical protein
MNPAEIIATKLFHWFRHQNGTAYTHGPSGRIFFPDDAMEYPEDWPDLTDWNDIRRMEDALAERGLLAAYKCQLSWIWDKESGLQPPGFTWKAAGLIEDVMLRATPEQRVAAALKVIKEAGL